MRIESPHEWEKRIIDKKASSIDWDNSVPAQGVYRGRIVYYSEKGKSLAECPWHFGWIGPYDPVKGTDHLPTKLRLSQGWDFVRYNSDPTAEQFVPDGVPKNAEGYFQKGDLVLMRVPAREYWKRRKYVADKDKQYEKNLKETWRAGVERDGVPVSEPDTEDEFARRHGI